MLIQKLCIYLRGLGAARIDVQRSTMGPALRPGERCLEARTAHPSLIGRVRAQGGAGVIAGDEQALPASHTLAARAPARNDSDQATPRGAYQYVSVAEQMDAMKSAQVPRDRWQRTQGLQDLHYPYVAVDRPKWQY